MIDNLEHTKNYVEWDNLDTGEKVSISLPNIFIVSENVDNGFIFIQTGENFISDSTYYYDYKGNMLLEYHLKNGFIHWWYKDEENKFSIEKLIDVYYFPNRNIIAIVYSSVELSILLLNLSGDYIGEISSPRGYKIQYLEEFPNCISVVCDGDENHVDKFGRNRFNFRLDLENLQLIKQELAY